MSLISGLHSSNRPSSCSLDTLISILFVSLVTWSPNHSWASLSLLLLGLQFGKLLNSESSLPLLTCPCHRILSVFIILTVFSSFIMSCISHFYVLWNSSTQISFGPRIPTWSSFQKTRTLFSHFVVKLNSAAYIICRLIVYTDEIRIWRMYIPMYFTDLIAAYSTRFTIAPLQGNEVYV